MDFSPLNWKYTNNIESRRLGACHGFSFLKCFVPTELPESIVSAFPRIEIRRYKIDCSYGTELSRFYSSKRAETY
jgi:hypothetical protein